MDLAKFEYCGSADMLRSLQHHQYSKVMGRIENFIYTSCTTFDIKQHSLWVALIMCSDRCHDTNALKLWGRIESFFF